MLPPAPSTSDPNDVALANRPIALVTAGPTEEPIDDVRFLGNRSSGRMGLAIAVALADLGWRVRLAVGPIRVATPSHRNIEVVPFRTSRDLETLLRAELPQAELVVMAAAVADYRPITVSTGKMRRTADGLTLALEGVPDLLATTRDARRAGSRVFGFALEPAERLRTSALEKLERKDLTGIVANPLETMDAPNIDGTLFLRDGRVLSPGMRLLKDAFARWLAQQLTRQDTQQLASI
jgi:phosphopantothenoylcysteine decarboxylase/phosphopantothenate--cysteine ligase